MTPCCHGTIKLFTKIFKKMEKQFFYDFNNSVFSKNSPYRWVYCLENSKLISYHITGFKSVFDLLTVFAGYDDLLIHKSLEGVFNNDYRHLSQYELEESKFFNSNLNETDYFNTLAISTWSEKIIVGSAVFFIFETLYKKNGNRFKYKIRYIIDNLAPLIFSSKFNMVVIDILKKTNIVKYNMYEICCGLKVFLEFKDSVKCLEEQFGF